MILPMLVVDKNVGFSLKIQAEWLKRGISTVRVDTMQEAIEKLGRKSFLFTAINADNTNYLPLLRIMADISPTPIFIMTSNFTVCDQTEAFQHGADGYAPFYDNVNESIDSALALLQKCNERNRQSKRLPEVILHENIFVLPSFRKAFYNDTEIDLTKTEFNLLYYLMSNRGRVLTFRQIYRKIRGAEYQDSPHSNIRNHISRLREKLIKISGRDYIENVRDVGYRFILRDDK